MINFEKGRFLGTDSIWNKDNEKWRYSPYSEIKLVEIEKELKFKIGSRLNKHVIIN